MQELNFELYKLIKSHDSGDHFLECLMTANDSFIPSFVVLNSADEIFQQPVLFKFILDDSQFNVKNSYKNSYSCLMAKFNDDGIIIKKSSKQKISSGTNSFGLLKSVILILNKLNFNELVGKINHLKGVKLILAEDSFEQIDSALFFNRFTGDIISFEIIYDSYEDLQNEIMKLKNDNGKLRWREVKQQLDNENTFLNKIGRFFGL
jgi:hypothetical protein